MFRIVRQDRPALDLPGENGGEPQRTPACTPTQLLLSADAPCTRTMVGLGAVARLSSLGCPGRRDLAERMTRPAMATVTAAINEPQLAWLRDSGDVH